MANQRDKLYNEAIQEAFYKLDPEDQEAIDQMVNILCKKIHNMGVLSALEILSKIGIIEIKREDEMITSLDIIEKKTAGDKGWKRKQYVYHNKAIR